MPLNEILRATGKEVDQKQKTPGEEILHMKHKGLGENKKSTYWGKAY